MLNLVEFLRAANISSDARKRASSLGLRNYTTKGKHVGGRRVAPANPVPHTANKTDHRQHLSQAGILKKEVQRLETKVTHLESTAEKQRKLRLHAEKELRRQLRNLDQLGAGK